jgi:ABC-type uncharacterized transport system substrate-binding protein
MQFGQLKRREFITFLGGAAAWPLAAHAQQQPAMPVIGVLGAASADLWAAPLRAFHQGLGETGYVEARNVAIEYRWAQGQNERLPELAAELVRRQVAVIAVPLSTPGALAAKAATTTIPVVFQVGSDPIAVGLVTSLNRPGGNLTGTTIMGIEMGPKRLELMRQLVPNTSTVAMLVNPKFPTGSAEARDVQRATHLLGMKFHELHASTENEIDAAFAAMVKQRADVLIIATDPFLLGQRDQIVALAARHAVPTMYFLREFVEAGGLASYGPNIAHGYRQAGVYTGRILGGATPAILPVLRPTHFLLILNLKTSKALGLAVSDKLIALADEVIE